MNHKEASAKNDGIGRESQSGEDHNSQAASPADGGVAEKTVILKESDHERLLNEAAQLKDKYLRIYAEFENARKRMDRERQEFIKYANEGLIAEFLNILDNLERSVEAAQAKHEDYAAFLQGVEMIMAQIHEMLKKNSVRPIDAKGQMFDPHCHEILMQEEFEGVEEGTVLEEFQRGYTLGGRVIRTSKVKVAKNQEKKKN